ncbi:MAG: DNA-processing protein DprA [Clostridia bacterium]|nr:DNA-processing protein DprA [Clostridia bacterium]
MEYTKEQLSRIWMQCAPMGAWNKLREWTKHLGGPEQVWDLFNPDFYPMLDENAYAYLADSRASRCAQTLYQLKALNAIPLFLGDVHYPALLSHISDPPDVLFCQGKLPPDSAPAIAIVGSRSATRYGLSQARRIGRELAQKGVTVISGLARGIDAAAHEGALEGGGRTIAVLGSGIGDIYPPENKNLAARIVNSGGAILSEI